MHPHAVSNVAHSRFINRDDVDFDVAESYTPVQTWELVEGSDDVLEYATRQGRSSVTPMHHVLTLALFNRVTKFTSVRNITLFFPENFGGDTSILRFVGFKGEWTEVIQ